MEGKQYMQKNMEEIEEIKSQNNELKRELSKLKLQKQLAEQQRDQFLNELTETRNSKTYKIARGLTCIPRKLRAFRHSHKVVREDQTVYPYMISVVMAVYNTEEFLREMLDSILAQKQDVLATYLRSDESSMFRKQVYENIYELILVDDGSTDSTSDICDEYAKKYPWIKVLHKENGGVSSARNAGIEIATGKYITFPDSDDKITPNVFEECFLFFEAHENDISLVTYPLRFFDAQSGDHWTTYRFAEGTRILDMMEEWDKPQYFTAASFFKTASLKEHIFFDRNLINGEDIKFAHEVMYQDTPRIGLISNCTYWYRRRSTGEQSAIQQSKTTEKYYIPYITDMLGWLMKNAKNTYGEIPKYVQYAVMGQLQWRLRSDGDGEMAKSIIGEEGFAEYRRQIKELVKQIDTDVIMSQKQLFREHLFWLGSIKTDGNPEREYDGENINYSFDGVYCSDAASCYLRLEFMKIEDGVLYLEGASANLEPDCENWILIGEQRISVDTYERRNADVKILDEAALFVETFKVQVPLAQIDQEEIYFGSTIKGMDVKKTRIVPGKFMPITKELSKSYYSEESWTVRLEDNRLVIWNMDALIQMPDFEQEFESQILGGKFGKSANVIEAVSIRKEALNRRAWKRHGKQIWLISDRYSVADDNGEALFEYLANKKDPRVEIYFVIAKDSKDFERLKEIGKVVEQDSREHMLLHLTADCIISSQADEYIIDPVWRKGFVKNVYKDLYCRSRFVFLQHGVIKDDLSSWLNRYNKNIDGFVCTAFREAQSVRDCDYYYDDQVWLTGLPRYDRLYHDEKKYIMVMPTWRKWLMTDFNASASDKDATHVNSNIVNTEYFEFYHALLNNERLLAECDKYGYKLCFMPHTNIRESMHLFCEDERVICFDFDKPYREAFAEADLLITDYSSTAMDFAYLRKPVIYAQFDSERFFSGEHTYEKGYFDYERDGFGDVVYDLDTLVDDITQSMKNGCILSEKYKNRIDSFFEYNDKKNSERVYKKLQTLMELPEYAN